MKYKTNCFWYDIMNDMGAEIHFCNWYKDKNGRPILINNCPSSCKSYINIEEAKTIIASWQNRDSTENK